MARQSLSVLFCMLCISLAPALQFTKFVDRDNPTLVTQLVEVHNVTGDVYMVTWNNLYHLDSDLVLKKKVTTGPQRVCKTPETACDSRILSHYIPYALKIVYHLDTQYIMLCGSMYDGMCQLRPLHDLDRIFWIGPYDDKVARCVSFPVNPAFFGHGYDNQIVFYTGSHWLPKNGTDLPFLSSKVLVHEDGQFRFKYAYDQSDQRKSALFFRTTREQYHILSFSHGSHAYFLFIRLGDKPRTVLARICVEDGTFTSYVEQNLWCLGKEEVYSIALVAFFGPGFYKGEPMEHLYLVFHDKYNVICDYNILTLNRMFDDGVADCFEGKVNTKKWDMENGELVGCQTKPNSKGDTCGSSINSYIVSHENVISRPVSFLNVEDLFVTTLAVFEEDKKILAFIGANNGIVGTVLLDGGDGSSLLHLHSLKGHKVQRSVALDAKQEHVYVLNYNEVIKYPLLPCSLHKTCKSCLRESPTIYDCVWCGGKCSALKTCSEESSNNTCEPSITSIIPLTGPIEGGTNLTIFGRDFGYMAPFTFNYVRINNIPCDIKVWEHERVLCTTGPSPSEVLAPVVLEVKDDVNQRLIFKGIAESHQKFSYGEVGLTVNDANCVFTISVQNICFAVISLSFLRRMLLQ